MISTQLSRFFDTYKNHYKALVFLGLPIVIGQIGVIIFGFADTLMIGHHSTAELGVAFFVNNLFNLAIIFSTGFSYGLTPIVGGLFGTGQYESAGQALRNSLLANSLVAFLIMLCMSVLYWNVESLGQLEELIPIIKPYNLGTIALAFHQVMLVISQFTFMMYYGVGVAVAVRVSNFNGQHDIVNVRRAACAGFHKMMALGVVLSFIVFLFCNQLGYWFNDNPEVVIMVTSLIVLFLIYQFGDGLQIMFANTLRGISDVKPMMFIAFIAYFMISLPVGYLCGFVFDWGNCRCLDGISFRVDQCRMDALVAFPFDD
ncbi:MATE efflux family protein [gut metagenome]|uniref:MATE efflux family protein n=1 Tax=gut metagenome TaxID=749906 RepID=J9CJR6_9ZZZZ